MSTKSFPPSLRVLLARLDTTLTRLHKILSTPGGIDTTLLTLNYTLTFLHARLSTRLHAHLHTLATKIAHNASTALLPGETVIAQIPAPQRTARLARAATASKKLADLISDFRVFMRLWGLLGIYAWGKSVYVAPPRDRVVLGVACAQIVVCAACQILENGAYLAQHGVLEWEAGRLGRAWLWSSRFWCAHVVLEFVRLARQWRVWKVRGEEGEEKEGKIRRAEENGSWWRDAVVNAGYFPMTVHWGVEQGVLSEGTVGLLGMIVGVVTFMERWRASA